MPPAASFQPISSRKKAADCRLQPPSPTAMKISTLLPAIAAALICGTIIVVQLGRNRSLDQRLESLHPDAAVALTDGLSPREASRPSARLSNKRQDENETPAPGTPEFEERVARATQEMKQMISGFGDVGESPAAFFRALPGVIKVIADLGLEEAIAVADRLGSIGPLFPPADGNSTARLMIYLLASEQDPLRILERKDLNLDSPMGGLQVSIFGRLATRDPDTAMQWLDAQSIGEGPKTAYQRQIAFGLLAQDPRRGLDYLLENPAAFPHSGMGQIIADIPMPDTAKADLAAALPDPRYAEFRPAISRILMRSSLNTASVAALREQSAALQLSDDEVAAFLRENPSVLMQRDPAAATAWMKEALPAGEYSKAMASAIRRWTEQDFNAAANHLGTMERGPVRDQSIKEFAGVVAKMEPPSAARWALEIEDATLRHAALREVGESWLHIDPGAARDWMKNQGIPQPDAAQPETESP
jgi:hypothetical protein